MRRPDSLKNLGFAKGRRNVIGNSYMGCIPETVDTAVYDVWELPPELVGNYMYRNLRRINVDALYSAAPGAIIDP